MFASSDKKNFRFIIEKELTIEAGCKCLSCWEYTGRILISDNVNCFNDDIIMENEEELLLFLSNLNEYYLSELYIDI